MSLILESIGFGEGEKVNRNDHRRTTKQKNKKYKQDIHEGVDRIDTVDVEREGPMKYDEGRWFDFSLLHNIHVFTSRLHGGVSIAVRSAHHRALQRSM